MKEGLLSELQASLEFFKRSMNCLSEEDLMYTPNEEMYSVSQMVAHVAQTVDWFVEGAFVSESGFSLEFDVHINEAKAVTSLEKAIEWLDKAFQNAIEMLNSKTDEELLAPLTEGPIMGGLPKCAIVGGIVDHTSHHRGALSVYSRLIGKDPVMPYGEV